MFHAFGNNPITYTDPDGRYLINNVVVFNNYGKSETAETYALSNFEEIRATAKKSSRLGWWKTEDNSYKLVPLKSSTHGFKNDVAFADKQTMSKLKSIAASQKSQNKFINEIVFSKVTTEKEENEHGEEMMSLNKKKIFVRLVIFIISITAYGNDYKILPSTVIEYVDGKLYEQYDLMNKESSRNYIVEITDENFSVYCFSENYSSNCECIGIEPDNYKIQYRESVRENIFHLTGNNGDGKLLTCCIDIQNRTGSLCIFNQNGIYLYIEFDYF